MKIYTRETFEEEVKFMATGIKAKIDFYSGATEITGEFIRLIVSSSFPSMEEWEQSGRKNINKITEVRPSVCLMRGMTISEMSDLQIEVRDMQKLAKALEERFVGKFVENY